jgi:sugar/nucleoside kinase (ribokinase family)
LKQLFLKLGDDLFGRSYLQSLKDNKINTDYVFFTDKAATGVAPIMVDKNGSSFLNHYFIYFNDNLLT